MALVDQYRRGALSLIQDPGTHAVAFQMAGFAVECAMKAAIMKELRLNQWPSRSFRPNVYEHDLVKLAAILELTVSPSEPIAPAWSTLVQWRRDHMYHVGITSIVSGQLVEAALDPEEGVVAWLSRLYQLN